MHENCEEPIVLTYASRDAGRDRLKRLQGALAITYAVLTVAAFADLVVPRRGRRTGARRNATIALIGPNGTLASALECYEGTMGSYPELLRYLGQRPPDIAVDDERWYPFLVEKSFLDPWGRPLEYLAPGKINTHSYDLISRGPDGRLGTKDDITNYRVERRTNRGQSSTRSLKLAQPPTTWCSPAEETVSGSSPSARPAKP